jgi:hypothetical protein
MRTREAAIVGGVALGLLVDAAAQSGTPGVRVEGPAVSGGITMSFGPSPLPDVGVVAGPLEIGGQMVADAPYTAEATTETSRLLGDGNRIVQSSTVSIARDRLGRTRREQGLAVIGPLVAGQPAGKQVVITDPASRTTYILDLENRKALRWRTPAFSLPPVARRGDGTVASGTGAGGVMFEAAAAAPVDVAVLHALPTTGAVTLGGVSVAAHHAPTPHVEDLGTQSMEGIAVQGTRSTVTIPEGQIGNERPIEIVSERWVSPQLQTLVSSRQDNPLFGETSYRLTNIVLGDPPAWMFEVPPDFEIVESPVTRSITVPRPQ